ncbi:MAG: SsrA-binding protein SmpB [Microgenomates group bacterium]
MKIINRRAVYDYEILEKLEAGIALTGSEVKSIKTGHLDLNEAFIKIKEGEAWLFNAHIYPYKFAFLKEEYDPRRPRKLLLHKKEILKLAQKTASSGLTIIPLSCYTKNGKIKLEIALAKGRKKYQKKELLKKREVEKEIEESLRKDKWG